MIITDGEWIIVFPHSPGQKEQQQKGLKELKPMWILQCWTESIFGAKWCEVNKNVMLGYDEGLC